MNTKDKIIIGLLVAILGVGIATIGLSLPKEEVAVLGTDPTINPSTDSYSDSGADLRQNVQAVTERMDGLTQYQILQASSRGIMEAVAPGSLAGTGWNFDGLYTDSLNYLESYTEKNGTATSTVTLTTAMSGETFYIEGVSSTIFTLPATSTAAGVNYKFVVAGALGEDCTVVTSDAGDNIEGTLLVAGAVVDCDAEDTITFVADGENIGDFFEIRSDGDYWLLGASGALSSSKLTCTTT